MRLAGRLIDLGSSYLLRGPLADPSQSLRNQAGVVADPSLFESMVPSTWKGVRRGYYVGFDSTAKPERCSGQDPKPEQRARVLEATGYISATAKRF